MNEDSIILEVKNLVTGFSTDEGYFRAVDGLSFTLREKEILGIAGESGCGKSVTALSIMRLLPEDYPCIESGEIIYEGKDILKLSGKEMRKIRGNKISMIFQEPMSSLNPSYTCGSQILEAVRAHRKVQLREAKERVLEMLEVVGIPDPARRYSSYPHELSGGMRQRVMIAMALACSPKILIADEPTTALDVTVQAQILDLILKLKEEMGMSVILITHDLGIIAQTAQRILIMYAAKACEYGTAGEIFSNPKHPYTRGLLDCVPRIDVKRDTLSTIEGVVPSPSEFPAGCRFSPRCPLADEKCTLEEPPPEKISETRYSYCWKNQH